MEIRTSTRTDTPEWETVSCESGSVIYKARVSRTSLPTRAMDQCIVGDSRATPCVVKNYNVYSQNVRHV